MLCCCPSNIPRNATVQLIKLSRILLVLAFVQLVFASFSFWVGLLPCLCCVIGGITLLMVSQCRNFCGCIFYVFISLMDGLITLTICGNNIAENSGLNTQTDVISFILLLKLVFYMVSIYYNFLAYRELKALTIQHAVARNPQSMLRPSIGLDGAHSMGQALPDDRPQPFSCPPFSGQGHRLE